MEPVDPRFVAQLMSIGIVMRGEQDALWRIARRCATTVNLSIASRRSVTGDVRATVTVLNVGELPAELAGLLAGLAGGTVSCLTLSPCVREQLKSLGRSA